jgi:hypothetical protein
VRKKKGEGDGVSDIEKEDAGLLCIYTFFARSLPLSPQDQNSKHGPHPPPKPTVMIRNDEACTVNPD